MQKPQPSLRPARPKGDGDLVPYRFVVELYGWQWKRLRAECERLGIRGEAKIRDVLSQYIRTLPAETKAQLPDPLPPEPGDDLDSFHDSTQA